MTLMDPFASFAAQNLADVRNVPNNDDRKGHVRKQSRFGASENQNQSGNHPHRQGGFALLGNSCEMNSFVQDCGHGQDFPV